MTQEFKETLYTLSQEHLIHLIEQYEHSLFLIGETCVDESKSHISPERAVDKIRKDIYHIPYRYNPDVLKAHINLEMGRITQEEFRRILLGE